MSETLEIPGRGSKKSALGSLLEFRDYFGQMATWVDQRKAEAGAPVFFAHTGMPTVVVSVCQPWSEMAARVQENCIRRQLRR